MRANPVWMACLIAVGVRLTYALVGALIAGPEGMPDYWGDAYHNWIVERLTLENGFVFTDYKGRELVWLPLFRYLAAATMGITGLDGLLPGRLVSLVAGVGAVGFVTAAMRRWTGRAEWALVGGLLLALNPWHIAYSWMNMPEAVGTLWIAMAFWAIAPRRLAGDVVADVGSATGMPVDGGPSGVESGNDGAISAKGSARDRGRWDGWVLLLAGAAGALTRNDVTSILALTVGALLLTRRVRPALFLLAGIVIGLSIWSAWTGFVTGNPLWWLARRAAGSTDDAGFWIARGSRPDAALLQLVFALGQACTVAAVGLVLAPFVMRDRHTRAAFGGWQPRVPLMVGGVYLVIVGVMFTRFFSWPDPRYLVMAIVPMTIVLTLMIASLRPRLARRTARVMIGVALLSTVVQLPTFPIRAWAHERDRIAGRAIAELEAAGRIPAGPIWIDAPVAILSAGMELTRIRSSDQITGWGGTDQEALTAARAGIRDAEIGLIYFDEVPYSRVHRIWPAMADGVPFEDDGLRFTPIFQSDTVTRADESSTLRGWRERIQGKYGAVSLWRVER